MLRADQHRTERYVALLRGVNVGGNKLLPMKDLAEMFRQAGCSEVRTYLQSGNVVFTAEPPVPAEIPDAVTAAIAARFGFKTRVLLRTRDQLAAVISGNPYLARCGADGPLHVLVLSQLPDPERVATLDPERSEGDAFHVSGMEVYLYLPNGVAGRKLSNSYFDSKLAAISTGRNWRTVTQIYAVL